jgi:hypothetical protein
MTNAWNDFNDAKQNTNLIPKGTIAKVRLTIRPGGFDDPGQGWTGGYARRGTTGSVYLDVEYTVVEGPFAKRKIWSMIGLYSASGPNWANMGRSLVRGILNSARGLSDKDNSPEAQNARRISGFADLDGIEFVARIDIGRDSPGPAVGLRGTSSPAARLCGSSPAAGSSCARRRRASHLGEVRSHHAASPPSETLR